MGDLGRAVSDGSREGRGGSGTRDSQTSCAQKQTLGKSVVTMCPDLKGWEKTATSPLCFGSVFCFSSPSCVTLIRRREHVHPASVDVVLCAVPTEFFFHCCSHLSPARFRSLQLQNEKGLAVRNGMEEKNSTRCQDTKKNSQIQNKGKDKVHSFRIQRERRRLLKANGNKNKKHRKTMRVQK